MNNCDPGSEQAVLLLRRGLLPPGHGLEAGLADAEQPLELVVLQVLLPLGAVDTGRRRRLLQLRERELRATSHGGRGRSRGRGRRRRR